MLHSDGELEVRGSLGVVEGENGQLLGRIDVSLSDNKKQPAKLAQSLQAE